ncbi:MAG: bifunctional phosphopantothenoylcysteine decarboxylase/phosphopantothenate--cysteine ligase CoaBC [Sulfurovaceae bacterium]
MILKGKKILLGVTGSIAAYKACDVAREFIKAGASVKIVMSEASKRFVSPLTFEALTREGVLHEGTESWANELNHIDITKWADVFVIAPASANTINKLSKGIADNLLLQCALAFDKPILIAPAANTKMLENHQTKNSIKMLEVSDMTIIKSQNKLLACGDEGNGALADPKEIYYQTLKVLLKDDFWSDRRVVVTSGGTIEKIDDVRFISNFSSGKMGHAIATALYLLGADVCLITTKEIKDIPGEIYTIDVEDAKEMQGYLTDAIRVAKKGVMSKPSINHPDSIGVIQKEPYLFMVAAVADYRAKYPQTGKMKKDTTTKELAIEFELKDDS